MNKRTLLIGLAGLIALFLAGAVLAQTSASYDLSWYTMSGGGGRAASASFAMNSTVGQAAVGISDSPSYRMSSGYWQPWLDRFLYLPLVMKNFL